MDIISLKHWALFVYFQHLIFCVTYKSDQQVRPFPNSLLERFTSDKHFNLLGQFLSYE